MDCINKYRNRMGYSGNSIGESFRNNTLSQIEADFTDSPTYHLAKVHSYEKQHIKEVDIRVLSVERLGSLKEILFRPSFEGLNLGAYLEFDDDTWLIFDKYDNSSVFVQKCNDTIKWTDDEGNIHEKPCVASASDLGSKAKQGRNELEWNKYDVSLPLGQLFIFVELTDKTDKLKYNQRFIFGTKVYEIIGYDDVTSVRGYGDERNGLLQLNIKVTTSQDSDDFNNRIANNQRYDLEDSDGDDSNNGGLIW